MMAYLGIDTSNYTTSVALYEGGTVYQQRRLLPVAEGALGLRQSDAVFAHVKALGELTALLMAEHSAVIGAIGVSATPRDQEGSYMPCFLTGLMAAEVTSSVIGVPLQRFSHQAGHVAAALYGAKRLDLMGKPFVSLHVSGGTTECLLVEDLLAGKISLLSATSDLNAGQAVDRVGKLLGLSFPAGKALDALACRSIRQFKPKPAFQGNNPCLSGLENQAQQMLKDGISPEDVAKYTIDYILRVVDRMAQEAVASSGCSEVLFAGGVMSNSIIQSVLAPKQGYIFSPPQYATDNAVGITVLTAAKEGGL